MLFCKILEVVYADLHRQRIFWKYLEKNNFEKILISNPLLREILPFTSNVFFDEIIYRQIYKL